MIINYKKKSGLVLGLFLKLRLVFVSRELATVITVQTDAWRELTEADAFTRSRE